jgi:hypothetical protein
MAVMKEAVATVWLPLRLPRNWAPGKGERERVRAPSVSSQEAEKQGEKKGPACSGVGRRLSGMLKFQTSLATGVRDWKARWSSG